MYQGKRRKAAAGTGYQPKRLRGPGKHLLEGPSSRPQWTGAGKLLRCAAVVAALCALVFTGATDLSTAYLHDQDSMDNTFVLGSVNPEVTEEFDGTKKENVTIQNGSGGNTPVYIRALILVTWQDKQSKAALPAPPNAGTDYDMTGPERGWELGSDGYYYYTKPVQPGESTTELIQTLTETGTGSDATRQLSVDIIAQSVQASPAEAVAEVFRGATVQPDGTLTPPAAGKEVSP